MDGIGQREGGSRLVTMPFLKMQAILIGKNEKSSDSPLEG